MENKKCTPLILRFEARLNPFNVRPPKGYTEPKNEQTGETIPNCCKFHKQLYRNTENWFQIFPLCCDGHTKMAQREKWFHKNQYNGLTMKIVKQISYMEYHINQVHKKPDWFDDITEFIDYNLESFGSFKIGLDQFTHAVKHILKDPGLKIPRAKKEKLLRYLVELETPKETIETDFNLLENIYRKWLHEFPFELEIFNHLKPKYEKTFPIVKEWGKKNRYTGHQIIRLHTKSTMIEQLEGITIKIISEINSLTLHKKGELNDPLKYELSLLEEKRNMKLKTGYRNDISTEPGYRKVLKEWFEDEKEFIQELQRLLAQAKPKPEPTKADVLQDKLSKYGFFELEKVKALSEQNQQKLVDQLSIKSVPYVIAMFEELGYFRHLKENYFDSETKINQNVANFLNSDKDGRSVKANRNVLNSYSKENKRRYTAHKYIVTVKEDYQNLSLGVLLS